MSEGAPGQLNRAYLALGSNIRPQENLRAAVSALGAHGRVAAVSRVWETRPLGFSEQPNYLNAAVLLLTPRSAQELRAEVIPAIERQLGRVRTANKNAPRTIDIDLMLFNRELLDLNGRHIPDAEVLVRPFVAIALADIAPDYVHPEAGLRLDEIARRMRKGGMTLREDIRLGPCSAERDMGGNRNAAV